MWPNPLRRAARGPEKITRGPEKTTRGPEKITREQVKPARGTQPTAKKISYTWGAAMAGAGIPVGLALPALAVLPPHIRWITAAVFAGAYLMVHVTWLGLLYRLRLRQEDRLDRLADAAMEEGRGQAAELYQAELAARGHRLDPYRR